MKPNVTILIGIVAFLCTSIEYVHANPDRSACRVRGGLLEYQEPAGDDKSVSLHLKPHESIKGLICDPGIALVLTNSALRVVKWSDEPAEQSLDGYISIRPICSTVIWYLHDELWPGIAAWARSPEKFFILTRDSKLHVLPIDDHKKPYELVDFPSDVSDAKMIFFSGFLFLATTDWIKVMSFSCIFRHITSMFSAGYFKILNSIRGGPEFFTDRGNLYFGDKNGGKKLKIVVTGQYPGDVEIVYEGQEKEEPTTSTETAW